MDLRSRAPHQFYYHAHAGAEHEAGHLHTVRLFQEYTAHLIAISMAETGWPRALFTLNLWSIGDTYGVPEDLAPYARQYRVESHKGDVRLVRFVTLMFRAFLPEIEALQAEKERAIERYCAAQGGADLFEDRAVEILSQVEIDVRAYFGRTRAHEEASGNPREHHRPWRHEVRAR